MSKPVFATLAILLALPAGAALAQFTGPSDVQQGGDAKYPAMTVEAIKAGAEDETKATIEGRIIRKLADEEYLFADDTGEIRVEIDDDDFPAQPVSETTRVRLQGEVDTHRVKETDFDVDRMTIIE
ncbi:YgiW/YdeI family stress tolerance OB fold protein [Shinella zoogloeoides]|uniref:NirD/YgiW/YdeI family stress tolerance protein n=1 Tax=Shinella zoogloeoides TaxID=352475 RepID=A0A6N8T7W4_SHIZO|nr:NirD/YgiW/YdeI family stress tolerance protein [Shinella zoogloeoides]MXN99371.1 NirD/YgiW/YdeI family stress tolerance protein [Shinella zoogloeoides]UEX82850.1 NirD/YgiW/YdeI family stress tolerance protein [Shinella zoogloeoides]